MIQAAVVVIRFARSLSASQGSDEDSHVPDHVHMEGAWCA